jgi:hypothetical protein
MNGFQPLVVDIRSHASIRLDEFPTGDPDTGRSRPHLQH